MILDLTTPEKKTLEHLSYQVQNFPDGQQDIRLLDVGEMYLEGRVTIKSRFRSFKDLEVIICAVKALRRINRHVEIELFCPCILGARSDRQFVDGGTSYLCDVVAPILNSLNFERVVVIDPHSDVMAACIERLQVQTNAHFIRWVMRQIPGDRRFVILSPDAGASKKIYPLLQSLGGHYPEEIVDVVICDKHRDLKTGKILHTTVPLQDHHFQHDFLIIDDICDGGRTFLEIAKVINNDPRTSGDVRISLATTHGIYSAGTKELKNTFFGVFSTNSYSDYDVTRYDGYHDQPTGVLQYNVF